MVELGRRGDYQIRKVGGGGGMEGGRLFFHRFIK